MKRIEQNSLVARNKMPRQIDSVDVHVSAPADDHIKHRERNRNAAPGLDHIAQERIFRIVIFLGVAAKPEVFGHESGQGLKPFAVRAGLGHEQAQPPSPGVQFTAQFGHRCVRFEAER